MNYRSEKYNRSGCLDMTAYLAIRNVQREKGKQKNGPKPKELRSNDRQGRPDRTEGWCRRNA